LASARRDTLLECPPDIDAVHDMLKARYGYDFKSWSRQVQDQLTLAWREYLRPGVVCGTLLLVGGTLAKNPEVT
jgi:hypothetical protein